MQLTSEMFFFIPKTIKKKSRYAIEVGSRFLGHFLKTLLVPFRIAYSLCSGDDCPF